MALVVVAASAALMAVGISTVSMLNAEVYAPLKNGAFAALNDFVPYWITKQPLSVVNAELRYGVMNATNPKVLSQS